MSRFYPHSAFAEDQPLSKVILSVHVLTRGYQSGALVGTLISLNRLVLSPRYRSLAAPATLLLRSAGTGSLCGTALLGVALAGRMRGREDIEWGDRSWRLLENRGQVEVDDWSGVGAVLGVMGSTLVKGGGWRGVLGGAGLGSLGGVFGYMGWRYGVREGKYEEHGERGEV